MTIVFDVGRTGGKGAGPKRYVFQVKSGGVADKAGNALDGEFTGRLPSGNGAPGGNFLARLLTQGTAAKSTASHKTAKIRMNGRAR